MRPPDNTTEAEKPLKDRDEPPIPDSDLLEIHRAVLREPPDPEEGRERGPWWLWAGVILAIFSGGFYLGRFGGAFFQDSVHVGYLGPMTKGTSPTPPSTGAASGSALFAARCVSCHQANGQGLPGAFPPLAGSEWVNKDPETMARIVLQGLSGPIQVKGATYNGVMPTWKTQMSKDEIASVLSYVRSSWGNQSSAITSDLVAKVKDEFKTRATALTAAELEKLRSNP